MNKIYWKNSKQKFAKSCGNLSDMQAVITVVISLVLMSIYNTENIFISLYNFKTGCVMTETLKCEHKGKKCCSIASIYLRKNGLIKHRKKMLIYAPFRMVLTHLANRLKQVLKKHFGSL